MTTRISDACARIRRWGEERDWRGYDPYDALNSPLAPYLTVGTRRGRRALTQAVKLSPLNLRPLLGIKPAWNGKAIALVASAYARLGVAQDDESARRQARRWLRWLVENSTADVGLGWGYHFDVQTRFFSYRRGTPNVIATSFAAHALLDGVELLREEHWREPAERAFEYLVSRLLYEDGGRVYFRYLTEERELVHNANVLGCSVLARTARLAQRDTLGEAARRALPATLDAQRDDGSWPYAEGSHDWVDNFHTAYVLEGLAVCDSIDGARAALGPGLEYWERELFQPDGTAKYYPQRLWPIEAKNYAQAIETWIAVSPWRGDALAAAERCASRLLDTMLTNAGHVVFQRQRWWTNTVPFVRWTTAPTFRALARLELVNAGAVA